MKHTCAVLWSDSIDGVSLNMLAATRNNLKEGKGENGVNAGALLILKALCYTSHKLLYTVMTTAHLTFVIESTMP